MTKTQQLHQWLLERSGWVYLCEIPFESFGLSKPAANETLNRLCRQGCVDFRIQGIKQYRANNKPLSVRGDHQRRRYK